MMRSLFSGVSGLKNHQTRMDVIGNNISNVNTTGFKSSRVTFADTLNQTLTGASSPTDNLGGTNPKQIGLGSAVASIDLLFTDGSVQSTGKNTDLCLSGSGLFVVSNGSQTYYTRDGAFEFDALGNYVLPGSGLKVQGWMADDSGALATTSPPVDIVVPVSKRMEPEATKLVTYTNNLNAAEKTVSALTLTDELGNTYVVPTNDNTMYTIGGNFPSSYSIDSIDVTLANGLKCTDASGTFANGGSVTLTSGTIVLSDNATVTIPSGSALSFTTGSSLPSNLTVSSTGTGTAILTDGTNNYNVSGITDMSAYTTGNPLPTTLKVSSITASDGTDNFISTGTNQTVTFGTATSVNGLQLHLNGETSPVTVSDTKSYTKNGSYTSKIQSASTVMSGETESKTQISGSFGIGQSIPISNLVTIYDTLGNEHNIVLYFTKTNVSSITGNTWRVSVSSDGSDSYSYVDPADGRNVVVSMPAVTLQFDTNGKYVGNSGRTTLTFDNGAEQTQGIDVDLSDITQFSGSNTLHKEVDGNAFGKLESVSIDSSGVITGVYTNGKRRSEAQVAVAQFNNASGLTKTGNSLYQESNNSGAANVNTATNLGVNITPSALEMSNVDIANEFADMIVTQRGFQSNSKIITVGDEMLETVINMKR